MKRNKVNNLKEVHDILDKMLCADYIVFGKSVNLKQFGFRFKFDKGTRRFGCCNHTKRIISLSKSICENNLDKMQHIRDVMLHEMAHGISHFLYGKRGHGDDWKSICREIGYEPSRTFDSSLIDMPKTKYTYVCSKCGNKAHRQKRVTVPSSCAKCHPNGYSSEYRLKLVINH